jgi:hypothetical protein
LSASQELGDLLESLGLQGLIFPSAVGTGTNLIVFLDTAPAGALELANKAELLATLKRLTKGGPTR